MSVISIITYALISAVCLVMLTGAVKQLIITLIEEIKSRIEDSKECKLK